jgi:predicted nuclease of restriction endonuclease-like RecB superfamily
LKQETHFQSAATDFTFETEEVTGSLFNDEDVEHAVQNVYQIHKKIYRILSSQEWLLLISKGTSTRFI